MIPTTVKTEFVNAVRDHIKCVLDTATTVARHTKRARLAHGTNDLHSRIHAADINVALHMLRSDPLYVTERTSKDKTAVVKLQDVVHADEEWMAPPVEVAVHHHWLAVDGVAVDHPTTTTTAAAAATTSVETGSDIAQSTSVVPGAAAAGAQQQQPVQVDHFLASGLLSNELQLFYTHVTTQLDDPAVLHTVATTRGLQELVPFFLRFAQASLYTALAAAEEDNNYDATIQPLQLLQALLLNPTIHTELYLHQLFPVLITATLHFPAAANVLVLAVRQVQQEYTTVAARVTAALQRSVTEGSLRALTALDRAACVASVIQTHYNDWNTKTQQAALTAGQSMYNDVQTYALDEAVWGDAIVATMRVGDEHGYGQCFV